MPGQLAFWSFMLAPVAVYLLVVFALLRSGHRQAIAASLICFVGTLVAGRWHISASRSSTAAIGLVFLPWAALVSGGLAIAFGASLQRRVLWARLLGGCALLLAVWIPVSEIVAGVGTLRLNVQRDADQTAREARFNAHRAELRQLLARVPARRADTLTALLRAHRADREYTLAVLEQFGVDSLLLDTLAHSPDLGIAYGAVSNQGTRASTLRDVYRSSRNRSYFLQPLAAHVNTPPEILREIHRLRPAPITGLDYWLARNPAAPVDVVADLVSSSRDPETIRLLSRHPRVSCPMLRTLAEHATPSVRADEILQTRLTACEHPGPAPVDAGPTNAGPSP